MDFEITLTDYWDNEINEIVELTEEEYENIVYEVIGEYFGVDEDIIRSMELQSFCEDAKNWAVWKLENQLVKAVQEAAQYEFAKTSAYRTEEGEYKYLSNEYEGVEPENSEEYKRYLELKEKFGY